MYQIPWGWHDDVVNMLTCRKPMKIACKMEGEHANMLQIPYKNYNCTLLHTTTTTTTAAAATATTATATTPPPAAATTPSTAILLPFSFSSVPSPFSSFFSLPSSSLLLYLLLASYPYSASSSRRRLHFFLFDVYLFFY